MTDELHSEKNIALASLKRSSEFLKKWLDRQAKFATDVSPWEPLFNQIIRDVEVLNASELRRIRPGEPCSHPGCMSHKSHPCEGCGRQWGDVDRD